MVIMPVPAVLAAALPEMVPNSELATMATFAAPPVPCQMPPSTDHENLNPPDTSKKEANTTKMARC
jgi:hypothetical protein